MNRILLCLMILSTYSSCRVGNCNAYQEDCPREQRRTGPKGKQGKQGVPGPVGPSAERGPVGETGSQGSPGESCTVAEIPGGAEITCPDGSTTVISDGENGTDGIDGEKGSAGSSCSVTQQINGSTIICEDGTSAVILNGVNAPPTAYSITEMKDPCGNQPGFDEILLKTASGYWIAHFASGANQFLTILTPGTYVTTDTTRCMFTLDNNGTIVNEHNY